ncbi:iron ABC transporter permease [Paracoccus sp. M683]|uniref:FecCD family ABC transporter permease n=1 Tax=Paracoccus sp. M683 TaxID=2594268 RepID=UPI00117DC0DB|nr:iron ABC transporter permease [Paracoccus sp. M683]TRW99381.1 iron ABC transporter permease [Paracoccus sp. M683]
MSWVIRQGRLSLRLSRRRLLLGLGLGIGVALLALAMLPLGSHQTGPADLMALLRGTASDTASDTARMILLDLRLPRILLALLSGAMLGLAGAAMQALTRNGLADPGLLGVKDGAAVAVVALILLAPQAPIAWRPAVGMAGGLAAALLVVALARTLSQLRFVLIGIGLSWFLSAGLAVLLMTSDIRDVQTAMIWMAGSLNAADWQAVHIAAIAALAGAMLLFATARDADAAALGDAVAAGLGVRLRRLAWLRFTAPVLLTAACVSVAGGLGFVGLIAPHLARLTLGGGQAAHLAASGMIGAALVLGADSIGRLAFAPLQLPAGIILALVGAPILVVLLWARRNQL